MRAPRRGSRPGRAVGPPRRKRRARGRSRPRAPCRRVPAAGARPAPRAASRGLLGNHPTQHRAAVLERQQPVVVRFAEDRLDLLGRPRVGGPFDPVGVRVLGGGESALGQAQLAHQVVERLRGDAAVALLAGHGPAVQIRDGQERVVVEHLLEVGDEPDSRPRIAVEAAANVVVHAALRPCGRASAAPCRARPRAAAEQELERRSAGGNLGAPPKPPCSGSNARRAWRAAPSETARERLMRGRDTRGSRIASRAARPAGRVPRGGPARRRRLPRARWRSSEARARGSGGK